MGGQADCARAPGRDGPVPTARKIPAAIHGRAEGLHVDRQHGRAKANGNNHLPQGAGRKGQNHEPQKNQATRSKHRTFLHHASSAKLRQRNCSSPDESRIETAFAVRKKVGCGLARRCGLKKKDIPGNPTAGGWDARGERRGVLTRGGVTQDWHLRHSNALHVCLKSSRLTSASHLGAGCPVATFGRPGEHRQVSATIGMVGSRPGVRECLGTEAPPGTTAYERRSPGRGAVRSHRTLEGGGQMCRLPSPIQAGEAAQVAAKGLHRLPHQARDSAGLHQLASGLSQSGGDLRAVY